jgi:hypothetical protein
MYALCEYLHISVKDILEIPYSLFSDHIVWKTKLEEEKKKKMDDHIREMKSKVNNKKSKVRKK